MSNPTNSFNERLDEILFKLANYAHGVGAASGYGIFVGGEPQKEAQQAIRELILKEVVGEDVRTQDLPFDAEISDSGSINWFKEQARKIILGEDNTKQEELQRRAMDYLVVARNCKGEGRRDLQELLPVHRDLIAFINTEVTSALKEVEGAAQGHLNYPQGMPVMAVRLETIQTIRKRYE